jgi:hypothetical protein
MMIGNFYADNAVMHLTSYASSLAVVCVLVLVDSDRTIHCSFNVFFLFAFVQWEVVFALRTALRLSGMDNLSVVPSPYKT